MKIEMAEHPQAILDMMDQIEQEVRRKEQIDKLKLSGAYMLIGVGVLGGVIGFFQASLPLIFGGVVFVILGFVIRSRLKVIRSSMQRFEVARQILRAIRDDTGRKGRVVGRLDLTSPQQNTKQTRQLGIKKYYRDPWLRVKVKLVDGNLLRLSLVDRVKIKSGWKTGRSGKKKYVKALVAHNTQFVVKLVVNPDLYRSKTGGDLTIAEGWPSNKLSVDRILTSLKDLYSRLEPIEQNPKPGA